MSVKGGYQILNLQNKDLQYSPTIPGAYEIVEGNYLKPIMISGIVIGGVEKPAVYRQPVVSGSSYVFENVYGYDVTLSDGDQLSLASTQFATRAYVEQIVEGGTLENAKPIYFHPIILYSYNTDVAVSFMVLDNSSTPYNTIDGVINLFKGFQGRILCVGGDIYVLNNNVSFTPSYLRYVEADNALYFVGLDSAGVSHTALLNNIELKASDYTDAYDTPNKIN